MRHPIVEASAPLLLALVFGTCSRAQVTKPSTREGDVQGTSAADGFQPQRAYVSSFGKEPSHHQATGYVSGTILDQSGAVSAGAEVRLSDEGEASNQEVKSGSNGQFLFNNVVPGAFRLTVTSPGFATREISAASAPRGNLSCPSDHPDGSPVTHRSACERKPAHPSPDGGHAD